MTPTPSRRSERVVLGWSVGINFSRAAKDTPRLSAENFLSLAFDISGSFFQLKKFNSELRRRRESARYFLAVKNIECHDKQNFHSHL
jgi:hypothetical protein